MCPITKTKFEKEIYRNLESFDNKFQFVINNGNYFKNLENFKLIQLSVFANKPKINAYKYLYVSNWVKNYSKFRYPFQYIKYKLSKKNNIHILPHILREMGPKNNIKEIEKFKKKYNINKNLFLVGRYGGYDSFDIPFVKEAIKEILRNDKNIFFIFCNTEPFIIDQRVRFIDKLIVDKDKSLFLDSIDLFIHARKRGETLG